MSVTWQLFLLLCKRHFNIWNIAFHNRIGYRIITEHLIPYHLNARASIIIIFSKNIFIRSNLLIRKKYWFPSLRLKRRTGSKYQLYSFISYTLNRDSFMYRSIVLLNEERNLKIRKGIERESKKGKMHGCAYRVCADNPLRRPFELCQSEIR